jgi:hypothetical protein
MQKILKIIVENARSSKIPPPRQEFWEVYTENVLVIMSGKMQKGRAKCKKVGQIYICMPEK